MAPSIIATIPALKDVYLQLKTRMDKAVEDFRVNLAAARTGRASVHMLDTVRVPYYGSEMPLNQLGQVHAADAQLLTVQPFDPSILGEIDKAIRAAGLPKIAARRWSSTCTRSWKTIAPPSATSAATATMPSRRP